MTDYISFELSEENGETVFTLTVPEDLANKRITSTTTERLGTPRVVEQAYEDSNGEHIDFTLDLLGNKRASNVIPGPFASLSVGENKFVVWKK